MRKSRMLVVGLVVLVTVLGGVGLMYWTPSTNRAATGPTVSYNSGPASKYHAPLSAMGALGVDLAGSPIPRGTASAGPVTPTPDLASLPENGIRFVNDTSYMPQSETTIAVDPSNTNHVVGGVNDARFFFCPILPASDCPDGAGFSLSGFTVSADGGRSILKGDVLPGLQENVRNATGVPFPEVLISWGDPSIVPGVNGNFYYASLAISENSSANGIELAVSNSNLFSPTANCDSNPLDPTANNCWTAALVAGNMTDFAGSFEDKELVAVDRDASSPFYGYAYVSWDHFNPTGTTESYVARCSPALACTMLAGGVLPPLSGSDPFPVFTTPTVGTDGAAHFTWCNYGTFTTLGPISCRVRSTAPLGGAFGSITDILSFEGAGTTFPGYTGIVGFATEQFRTDSIPVIAADTSQTSNNLYFTVDACTAGNYYNFVFYGTALPGNCGESSILFSRSTDGGATWSTPTILSPSGVNVQPWVTVDPLNGAVVVAYYTTAWDSFNHRIDVVADVSNDQGTTFHQVRVTNVSNEPDSDPAMFDYLTPSGFGGSFIVPQYGDYMQVAALGGQLWVAYTANYAAELGTFQTDPWLTLAPENSPFSVAGTASPSLADPGVTVAFHGTATNTAGTSTFAWTFGDGGTATGADATHAYAASGTYTAQVTATDSLGRTATSQVYVTVITGLTAQLTSTPSATDVGLPVSFAATPAGGSGTYTYAWAFGDGARSTSATASHAYASAGTYTANLWVNDTAGGSAHMQSTVTVNPLPKAVASASASTLDVGQSITFAGSSSDGTAPVSLSWDFGDASHSPLANPAHAYAAAGTYTVRLTATDAVGGSASTTVTVTVAALPVATGSASTNAPASGDTVTFTGSSTGGTSPIGYAWNFGDGATSTDQNPTHAYATPGTYTVTLKVTDVTGASSTTTLTVVVSGSTVGTVSTTLATVYAIVGLVVGVLVGVLVAMLLRRRKGSAGGQSPPEEPSP